MCIDNRGHEGSLWIGKVYKVMRPERGDQPYDLRVIDETGEDYLYPARRFVPVKLPAMAQKAIAMAKVA